MGQAARSPQPCHFSLSNPQGTSVVGEIIISVEAGGKVSRILFRGMADMYSDTQIPCVQPDGLARVYTLMDSQHPG